MAGRDKRRDRQLLHRILAGQREPCEELVCTHYGSIYGFLYHMTRDAHLAEDLTQETFAAAWQNIAGFRGRATFGTWLHKIAYGKFVDGKRASERRQAIIKELGTNCDNSKDHNPFSQLVADERSRRVLEAVQSLAGADRVVITLHYLQGLSLRQTAAVLDEPVGTIKWRTNKALERLRGLFKEEM